MHKPALLRFLTPVAFRFSQSRVARASRRSADRDLDTIKEASHTPEQRKVCCERYTNNASPLYTMVFRLW